MKIKQQPDKMKIQFLGVLAVCLALATGARAASNSWKSGSGKWEIPGSWSLGTAPSINDSADFITNAGNNTVTMDVTTATNFGSTLIISNLTLTAPLGSTNTLFLNGLSNSLSIYLFFALNGNAAVVVSNSIVGTAFPSIGDAFNAGGDGNNSLLVTGAGSTWNFPSGSLYIGLGTSGNQLTVSAGAQFQSYDGYVGNQCDSNRVLVTGAGSMWITQTSSFDTLNAGLTVGSGGVGNQMTISAGGQVQSSGRFASGVIGGACDSNSVVVTGAGSVWTNVTDLYVGEAGSDNRLTVANQGSVIASNAFVTFDFADDGGSNQITVAGGGLYIADTLDVQSGTLTFNGGTVTANQLVLANGINMVLTFNSGLLNSGGTSVTNGQPFVVGDAVDSATFHLLGGGHSFANNLRVRNNATLSGCGTINGNVVVDAGGTVLADCGGSLTFTDILTNNGTMRVINGSVLEGYGAVVNNGTIDIAGGTTNFHGGFVNNGTIITGATPVPFQITGIVKQGNDIRITWQTSVGSTGALQVTAGTGNGSYSTNNFTAIFTVTNAVGTVTNYLEAGGATNKPARYYRVRLVP